MRHEEYQYLDLLQQILDKGETKENRTGIDTVGIFGTQMRFSLKDQFPILTTKKVYWRGVVEELLWFIRGETDSKLLEAKGVNIWKGNTSREYLDKKGLVNYPEGESGCNYSWNWRHFNGKFEAEQVVPIDGSELGLEDAFEIFDPEKHDPVDMKRRVFKCKTGPNTGVDQLKNVIEKIRTNPNDRRLIVTAWNPLQVDQAALPPCHAFFQFYVCNGKLSCQVYQRSVDVPIGLPFNISSYALLTYIVAKITGLDLGDLIWVGGDTHIYVNQIEGVKKQLKRNPYDFPKLSINENIKNLEDVENSNFEDYKLIGYKSHDAIKLPFAI